MAVHKLYEFPYIYKRYISESANCRYQIIQNILYLFTFDFQIQFQIQFVVNSPKVYLTSKGAHSLIYTDILWRTVHCWKPENKNTKIIICLLDARTESGYKSKHNKIYFFYANSLLCSNLYIPEYDIHYRNVRIYFARQQKDNVCTCALGCSWYNTKFLATFLWSACRSFPSCTMGHILAALVLCICCYLPDVALT